MYSVILGFLQDKWGILHTTKQYTYGIHEPNLYCIFLLGLKPHGTRNIKRAVVEFHGIYMFFTQH